MFQGGPPLPQAVQIVVGLLHIGLGAVLTEGQNYMWQLRENGFPYWMGVLVRQLKMGFIVLNYFISSKRKNIVKLLLQRQRMTRLTCSFWSIDCVLGIFCHCVKDHMLEQTFHFVSIPF